MSFRTKSVSYEMIDDVNLLKIKPADKFYDQFNITQKSKKKRRSFQILKRLFKVKNEKVIRRLRRKVSEKSVVFWEV